MKDNYYEDNYYEEHDCYYYSEDQKHRRNRRIARYICNILMGISAFCMLGALGGAENEAMSLKEFLTWELVATAVLVISLRVKVSLE